MPDSDASLIEEVEQRADVAFAPDWIGKDPATDPAVAARFLFHDCDEETLEWALRTVRLFLPSATYAERVQLNSTPSTYVVASDDRTIRPGQRRMARERLGIEPVEIAAGHCPHVSQPDQLAEMLVGLE